MADEALVMWSISQIAERDGVSKAAVSKAAKKLIEDKPDTPVERDGQGRVMLISLAHYDHHRQRFVNPAKATAPIRSITSTMSATVESGETFDEARRQSEWLKVARERIRHQEEVGRLLRRDKVEEAQRVAGREIQNIIRRLQNKADDVAMAVSKEGVHGVRVLLRQVAFEIGNEIASRLELVAEAADTTDELIEDEDA